MPLHESQLPRLARRSFLALAAAVPAALAQTQPRDWTNQQPARYPDPDIVALDKSFAKYQLFNAVIYRHYVGTKWAEGPAWCAQGQYLLWSDIPNNRQLRMTEEDGHVSVFRSPSGYSNGNTFDFEGRQLACEHAGRRVVRYEHDGTVTVIADKYNGKPLNSPNDVVVHPDGGVWFTDPPYGIMGSYEGFPARQEIKEAVYRVDPKTARIEVVTDALDKPNGICFSPDYKKLYVVDTGAPRDIQVFDVAGNKLSGGRQFTDMKLNGKAGRVGRNPRGRGRQHLGGGQRRRGLRRRTRVFAAGATHRHDPAAGDLRQPLLRRSQAEPAVHGGQPVAVLGVCRDARRARVVGVGQAESAAAAQGRDLCHSGILCRPCLCQP